MEVLKLFMTERSGNVSKYNFVLFWDRVLLLAQVALNLLQSALSSPLSAGIASKYCYVCLAEYV